MAEGAAPIELWAREEGRGPPVVLLHGAAGSHTVWNGVVGRLAKKYRVLAPDLRGHGKSPAPAGSTYSFEEMMADVLHFADGRSIDSAHWVGLSGGALLALRIALDAPERTRSLTMISGAAYVDAHTRSIAERWSDLYAKEGGDAFALRLLKDLYYPDWVEAHLEVADELRREVKRRDFGPAVAWGRAMAKFDEKNRIASVRAPTLIVQAMDDQVVDASHGRILRQSILHAQMRILANTGHLVPVERPAETIEAIEALVDGAEAARASGAPPAP
ncbi:MAG TPA: alpha/beta fold hydrolase [Thermoplasmata archaeon]|nr:alpha/beta fold hydrolase [Thermoplasmata archaeon]